MVAAAGQVDYVAANAFLDSMAQARPNMRTVQWGIWNQVGMAAEAFSTTDLSAQADELPPTARPLFDGRRRDTHGQLHFFGRHSPSTHWLYDEHRVKGDNPRDERGWAILPGTGYLELAAEALDELGERGPFEIRDLFFFRPLMISDGDSREVRVKMRRSQVGYTMEVRSACTVEGQQAWELHAQATIALGDIRIPPSVDLNAVASRTHQNVERGDGLRSPQERHLNFGGRWRVLHEVRYGDREALADLHLPEAARGDLDDWLIHPAMMDLATGFAMNLIEGYRDEDVWVPVSYESAQIFGKLPRGARSWVRDAGSTSDFAIVDVDVTDQQGNVLVAVRGFAMRRMDASSSFAVATPPTRADVEMVHDARREEQTQSPAEQRLRRNLEQGILPSEGAEALLRVLSVDEPRVLVSALELNALVNEATELATSVTGSSTKFARPDLDSDYLPPSDDIERTLVGFWEELLGVDQVGIQDSFFDLGGHSLIAVRLFAMVKRTFDVDFPISVLFEAPTIEACARLLRDVVQPPAQSNSADPTETKPKRDTQRYRHLVAMHPGEGGPHTPFFLVAGMFGNVLNLRHLAHLLGSDHPFYGLQAKGLYGGEAPHETFEEMAEAYLSEMRSVQPHGPYLLGGFSGGGYSALEMAQRLEAAGEEVALLVMLDTPAALEPKPLTWRDRLSVQAQRLEAKGPSYMLEWAQRRFDWEMGKLRTRFEEPEARPSTEFHNEAIEAAFRRALARYQIQPWKKRLVLFRPPLEKAFVLGPDRILNHDREYIYDDNGWSAYCDQVEVHEVPGDHDSMVLEPNVRVMAAKLRAIIEASRLISHPDPVDTPDMHAASPAAAE